jgi:hypothetical protein
MFRMQPINVYMHDAAPQYQAGDTQIDQLSSSRHDGVCNVQY